ncbi:MAG TPA: carboxylating nicotinate-nucleotide diphosphorylase [Corynebacteriales bacterium]|nr:carboxylating nicotinate-nucleotide diphosphorylase [Mycobacteriales bacterium]
MINTTNTPLTPPSVEEMRRVVRLALEEDLRWGPDVTTLATVPADATATAQVRTREEGIVCGLPVARIVLDEVVGPDKYEFEVHADDGDRVQPGDVVVQIVAPTQALLTAERTLLNIMTHLSGIATATDQWMQAMRNTKCVVRDTRKTLPGLRELEKYAVRAGGGMNHRMGLGDAALIKDNHVVAAGGVVPALQAVKAQYPDKPTEVEVDSLQQLREVLAEGVGLVLLDNMDLEMTKEAVAIRDELAPGTSLESSGGLTLADAKDYAATGVDYVAVGGLTHSVKVLDLGLDM